MNGTDDERVELGGGTAASRSGRQADRPGPGVAISVLTGLGVLLSSSLLGADEPTASGETSDADGTAFTGGTSDTDGTSDTGALESITAPAAPAGGGMIPRDAIIDMTRAQSGVICSSEIFLGCMGFDGTTCLSLSESAIDECLAPLPAEIDPTALDNATLEDCPRTVYAEAGYDETKADACFMKALDES